MELKVKSITTSLSEMVSHQVHIFPEGRHKATTVRAVPQDTKERVDPVTHCYS